MTDRDHELDEMDRAAEEARAEYLRIREAEKPGDAEAWVSRWYLRAGFKRLGRIMVECAKNLPRDH